MSDRNCLADPCLKRWQFFAGIVGFSAGGAVLFIATCFVWGFCFSFLNGHGPNDFEINEVVSRISSCFGASGSCRWSGWPSDAPATPGAMSLCGPRSRSSCRLAGLSLAASPPGGGREEQSAAADRSCGV